MLYSAHTTVQCVSKNRSVLYLIIFFLNLNYLYCTYHNTLIPTNTQYKGRQDIYREATESKYNSKLLQNHNMTVTY